MDGAAIQILESAYLDEQLLQALAEAEQEPQAEAAEVPSAPDQENADMSFRVWSLPQSGQTVSWSLLPMTICSKRLPHFRHWYSKMGILRGICASGGRSQGFLEGRSDADSEQDDSILNDSRCMEAF